MLVFYFSILVFVNLKVVICLIYRNEDLGPMFDDESYPKEQGYAEYQRKNSKTNMRIASLNTTKSTNLNLVTKKISGFKRVFVLKSFKNNNVTVVSKFFQYCYLLYLF